MYLVITSYIILVYVTSKVRSLPPDPCFQPFRWQDCGKPPQPVMYYWKSGSRCEVGFWRGCVPNLNMFKDEYECVSTCIFSPRARPIDFHSQNALEFEDYSDEEEVATTQGDDEAETTEAATTDDGDYGGETTAAEGGDGGDGGGGGGGGDDGTGGTGGGDATTAAPA